MSTYDRIWLEPECCCPGDRQGWNDTPDFAHGRFGHSDDEPFLAPVEYLRATPELLALITTAKEMRHPEPDVSRTEGVLHRAALAFTKSQDHPDAG